MEYAKIQSIIVVNIIGESEFYGMLKVLKKYDNILILAFLMLLSVVFVIPLQAQHQIYFGDDMPYHINRIKELATNIAQGNYFPQLYTYNFRETGFLLGIFYPQITLYPFAIASLILKSTVNGVYVGLAFYSFLSMYFMYLVTNKIYRRKDIALISAVIYGFCAYRAIDAFVRFALGEYLAMAFIPLALYGLYAIMFGNEKDWPYLGLGLSFIVLSHVLSTFLCVLIMAVLFLVGFYWMADKKKRLFKMCYAVVLFGASSAIYLVPFLQQQLYQKYDQPSPANLAATAFPLDRIFLVSLSNSFERSGPYSIGLVLLLVIIFGYINFNKLSSFSKLSLVIGSVIFVVSSNIFPWEIMMNTPVKVIQFPFRLSAFASVLLAFTGGELFSRLLPDSKLKKVGTVGIATLVMLGTWYSGTRQFINSPTATTDDNFIDVKVYTGDKDKVYYWYLDQYNTKKAVENFDDIFYHQATIDGKKYSLQKIEAIPDGLKYKDKVLEKKQQVILPISNYKNLHVYQGKKELTHQESKTGMVMIKDTRTGAVTVKYEKSLIDKLSVIVSMITWLGTLVIIILKKFSKKVTDK